MTPKTFRKAVGTRGKRKIGLEAASEQLHHGSTVIIERFYVGDIEDCDRLLRRSRSGLGTPRLTPLRKQTANKHVVRGLSSQRFRWSHVRLKGFEPLTF
ncbi:hypothetical protein ACFYO1_43055 [Nocardia sp. NPDC006044]|uniref:hypothetical protein n=1 Tax=Nocardia sp. NPDC006044 TaxID=3364306 RepID=UPI0036906F55